MIGHTEYKLQRKWSKGECSDRVPAWTQKITVWSPEALPSSAFRQPHVGEIFPTANIWSDSQYSAYYHSTGILRRASDLPVVPDSCCHSWQRGPQHHIKRWVSSHAFVPSSVNMEFWIEGAHHVNHFTVCNVIYQKPRSVCIKFQERKLSAHFNPIQLGVGRDIMNILHEIQIVHIDTSGQYTCAL